jgi:hypothetical protein
LEVMLQVLGKHEMLVECLQPAPKSKFISAFHSQAQSVTCYVQRCAVVHRKATIEVLELGEFLRCALL